MIVKLLTERHLEFLSITGGCRGPSESTLVKICLFVFVALRPKSTALVIAGRSVHLTTLFPGQA